MKIKQSFIYLILGALLAMPLFNVHAQPSETTRSALQKITAAQENQLDTIESRKLALSRVAELSIAEINDLKEQLNNLQNLEGEYLELRRKFLNALDEYLAYFEVMLKHLTENDLGMEALKELASESKNWRETDYNPTIRQIVMFVLVFREQAVIKTVTSHLEKIITDLNKLRFSKLIKVDQLMTLLNKAGKHLQEADHLNKQAQSMLLADDYALSKIQKLIEDAFAEITAAYKSFFKVNTLLKEMLGL